VRPNEQALFESKKTPFIEAFGWSSLYVTVVEDQKNRRFFRITPYSNRIDVLAQFTAEQIDLPDTLIKNRLMGGEFQPMPLSKVV